MSFLQLENIGKIYVSENSVAVGIRGVNLSFDQGEFVAITGKSGSGKSTLLNIISGMDTYEEGELYLRGEPTSHYVQADWEEYRKHNISFIFQDYNILESFTVLENVELALMNIEDKRKRREKALELLDRVGLSKFIHSKGSKLSGGQKQRTVIARALAKDSPIILADEPTGNLDSKTSEEIIQLLEEVSKDKLVIVVTHNFEQVEKVATRHIRIYDGSVESDTRLQNKKEVREDPKKVTETTKKGTIKDGFKLGFSMFKSKPKLSAFLCFLLILGTLGVFLLTALNGTYIKNLFKKNYMFTQVEGRVVLTKIDGTTITDAELATLVSKYGAKNSLHYDEMLDYSDLSLGVYDMENYTYNSYSFKLSYNQKVTGSYLGRLPEKENEIFLRLPISYKTLFDPEFKEGTTIELLGNNWSVVGVQYYRDNTIPATIVTTEKGFKAFEALYVIHAKSYYLSLTSNISYKGNTTATEDNTTTESQDTITPFVAENENSYYVLTSASTKFAMDKTPLTSDLSNWDTTVELTMKDLSVGYASTHTMNQTQRISEKPEVTPVSYSSYNNWQESYGALYISYDLLISLTENYLKSNYKQASIFFSSDIEASKFIDALREDGYIAVLSNATYDSQLDAIMTIIGSIWEVLIWALGVVFIAFFVNLCSSRAIAATRDELAIMRSMGIPVNVIRISIYVRMLIALIPCAILVTTSSILIYSFPLTSATFTYLHAGDYIIIAIGMLIISYRVASKQLKKLFGESVKKTLRGGSEA